VRTQAALHGAQCNKLNLIDAQTKLTSSSSRLCDEREAEPPAWVKQAVLRTRLTQIPDHYSYVKRSTCTSQRTRGAMQAHANKAAGRMILVRSCTCRLSSGNDSKRCASLLPGPLTLAPLLSFTGIKSCSPGETEDREMRYRRCLDVLACKQEQIVNLQEPETAQNSVRLHNMPT
jgi:hypothetical protein